MNLQEPVQSESKIKSKIKTEANSTAGAVFGMATALCGIAVMVMGVIKIGLIWFT